MKIEIIARKGPAVFKAWASTGQVASQVGAGYVKLGYAVTVIYHPRAA